MKKKDDIRNAHKSALKALKKIRAGKGIKCKNMREYKKSLEDL